jgi:hypothetical protein
VYLTYGKFFAEPHLNIFRKLQLADRAEVAIRAGEAGFDGEGP